ncbi:hypothetical protein GOZ80_14070 [Agrobacterium vitis]|uniref:Uncharacterized protein n=1 Tax=Agrobacterium vitis TaxID=373 RepID=A0A1S2DZJ0_AGRVI|nr:hypothetical protein [Agrobacterium vitis]KAA3526129.1 hypothetical protein DXT89_16525 [Agrobacterium vitis]MUO96602.1 hypothetical protein [Agrobacterium vitis]MUZ99361.1 hypothetical protein [Agrobacterium vitis]MVA93133.1 hypothetical protein [Agrobacterium vitis]MVB04020.1 hypothetical protein [Agrobacterium vitis]
MSLRDCLNSAVEQGAINSRQAEELHRYYEARFKQKRPGMTDREAASAARDEVVKALRDEAKENRRQVLLAEARRKEIANFIENYRNEKGKPDQLDAALSLMIHNGYKGTYSMDGRAKAITAMVHRDLSDVMYHFRRTKVRGRRRNTVDLPDLIKAMHGEPTKNEPAKAMAGALTNVLEDLRQRFNGAGGSIPKRADWGIPHSHDARKIRKIGETLDQAREEWKAFIAPLLNAEEMTNPKTGEVIGSNGISSSLDYVFESIMSDGWAHRKPESRRFGKGKVASRYQDGRFLIFKDAQSWLTYNERFGNGDGIQTVFNHINGVARDIAAMERFGPNPDATVEWIKQAIRVNIGKQQAGSIKVEGVKIPHVDAGKISDWRIDSLWRSLRGRDTVSSAAAEITGDIRNLASSAALQSTSILAAVTDPFVAQAARRLAALPITSTMGAMIRRFANDTDRRGAARRAVIWDDFMHVMNEKARFVDQMFANEWSKHWIDRALTWNGLIPLTDARKRIEASAWHDTLGGFAEKNTDWIDLHPLLKKAMAGFGFTPDDWHRMRAGVDEMGFLDPGGVFEKTGDRGLAEKYAELITQWSERSVPSGDPRIKSALVGKVERGTILGEIAEFGSQFMSFGMSFTARQMEAIYVYSMLARSRAGKIARGGWYFSAMAIPLMFGAAAQMQTVSVLNGGDPMDMTDPTFWIKAFVKGGGGGLFADFADKAENRFGQGIAATLGGIGGAFISDSSALTYGIIQDIVGGGWDLARGNEPEKWDRGNVGQQTRRMLGRYTPILSSHPFTRAAYRRMFIDQLQWLTDPEADEAFRRQQRKNLWWQPGNLTPSRLPDFSKALGAD